MDWKPAFEIFCLVTGVAYLLLEIGQKNAMWFVGIVTGAACAVMFGFEIRRFLCGYVGDGLCGNSGIFG